MSNNIPLRQIVDALQVGGASNIKVERSGPHIVVTFMNRHGRRGRATLAHGSHGASRHARMNLMTNIRRQLRLPPDTLGGHYA